ncbi:hypothetical protein [Streptomyces sp. FBKL.4005]|nr:hypothetical protein [Streptomyces sp. FBKL.4005]
MAHGPSLNPVVPRTGPGFHASALLMPADSAPPPALPRPAASPAGCDPTP